MEVQKTNTVQWNGEVEVRSRQRANENANIEETPLRERSSTFDVPVGAKQDPLKAKPKQMSLGKRRSRHQTMSCNSYFSHGIVMTEAAKNLSEEEMRLLEVDIFKPLDFYGIMFNRMKANEEERCSSESGLPVGAKQDTFKAMKPKQMLVGNRRRRSRHQTILCDGYFTQGIEMTEAANNLSEEEMRSLETDIFKPLDFFPLSKSNIVVRKPTEAIQITLTRAEKCQNVKLQGPITQVLFLQCNLPRSSVEQGFLRLQLTKFKKRSSKKSFSPCPVKTLPNRIASRAGYAIIGVNVSFHSAGFDGLSKAKLHQTLLCLISKFSVKSPLSTPANPSGLASQRSKFLAVTAMVFLLPVINLVPYRAIIRIFLTRTSRNYFR